MVEAFELEHPLSFDLLLGDEPRQLDRPGQRLDGDQRCVRVEDGDAALVERGREPETLEQQRAAIDPCGGPAHVTRLLDDLHRQGPPRQQMHADDGRVEARAEIVDVRHDD